jgi:hypothetical protein
MTAYYPVAKPALLEDKVYLLLDRLPVMAKF